MARVIKILDISLYCVCGQELLQTTAEVYHPTNSITVKPCPKCLEEIREEERRKDNAKTA